MKNKKTLILVLAYNASSTIEELLDRIPPLVYSKSDILVADDASRDDTHLVAEKYKKDKAINRMKVVKHKKNKGYGGNQKWGYDYAIENGYDIVVMLHGDVQYAPEYIPSITIPLERGDADFVFGSRITGDPLGGGMPMYKYLGNKFLTGVENIVLGTSLSEFHSGFRAYSVGALRDLPLHLCSDDFHFDSEIIVQFVVNKKKIYEVTIPTRYAKEICYVNVVSYGLNVLRILLQYLSTRYKLKEYDKFKQI
jgi:glycosyltransferase involved in cell wall biosynthesis